MRDDFNIPNLGQAPKDYDAGYLNRVVRNVEMVFTTLRAKGKALFTDITADTVTATTVTTETLDVTGTSTFRDPITLINNQGGTGIIINPNVNANIELGRQDGIASTPFIDFHSGSTNVDFDVRLIASGGTGSNAGGVLDFSGAALNISNVINVANYVATPTMIVTSPTGLIRNVTNGVMQLSGGSTAGTGANIELYGPSHAQANNAFYDGATHTFRDMSSVLTPLICAGITFPATQIASTNVNTLDDYEEGTFTPSITFGNAQVGMTFSTQVGSYIKIGKLVHVNLDMSMSAKGSSTGAARVINLPFTADAVTTAGANWISGAASGMATLTSVLVGKQGTSESSFAIRQSSASGTVDLTDANFTNASRTAFSGTYMASS